MIYVLGVADINIKPALEIALLERIVAGIAAAAKEANVYIVTGDTKVVRKGEGGGLYLATTGIGVQKTDQLSMNNIRTGDLILVSGPVGDHGTAVMLAREEFGMRGDLQSDAASVIPLTKALYTQPGTHFMRDPTRGGLASVMQEVHRATGLGIQLIQDAIPVRDPVQSVCEMLGYDPLYLACEGRVVAIVDPEFAEQSLAAWQSLEQGAEAAIIGTVTDDSQVVMQTPLGGNRILEELEDEPLPRIC